LIKLIELNAIILRKMSIYCIFNVQYKIILKIREIDLKISTSVLHKDFLFTEMQNKMIIRSPS
jgi:hypothetical protein